MIENLPKELDPAKFCSLGLEIGLHQDTETYEKCFTRTSSGYMEPLALFQVKRSDGETIFVLADSEEGAASQACIEVCEKMKEEGCEEDCEVKRVPMRYRGWGKDTF